MRIDILSLHEERNDFMAYVIVQTDVTEGANVLGIGATPDEAWDSAEDLCGEPFDEDTDNLVCGVATTALAAAVESGDPRLDLGRIGIWRQRKPG